MFPFREQANPLPITQASVSAVPSRHTCGRGSHPTSSNATSMVSFSFSTFPIQSQKNTDVISAKHITDDFPLPCWSMPWKTLSSWSIHQCWSWHLPWKSSVSPSPTNITSPNAGWGSSYQLTPSTETMNFTTFYLVLQIFSPSLIHFISSLTLFLLYPFLHLCSPSTAYLMDTLWMTQPWPHLKPATIHFKSTESY